MPTRKKTTTSPRSRKPPPPPKRSTSRKRLVGDRVHGEVEGDRRTVYDDVYDLVKTIPQGRVMTYGQIATVIEARLSARAVGWALHGCPDDVPWQRVVNASGGCSTDRIPDVPTGCSARCWSGRASHSAPREPLT